MNSENTQSPQGYQDGNLKNPTNQVFFKKDVLAGLSPEERYGHTPVKVGRYTPLMSFKATRQLKYSRHHNPTWKVYRDPSDFFSKETQNVCNVFNEILKYKTYYGSQQTLSDRIGVRRETVNRILQKLSEYGLVHMNHRGVKKTNEIWVQVELHRWLWKPWVRRHVMMYLPHLYTQSLAQQALDISLLKAVKRNNVTQYINNKKQLVNLASDTVPYRDRYAVNGNGINKHTGEEMEKKLTIPSHVHRIQSINLTEYGKVRLSGFPAEAIQSVDGSIQKVTYTVTDPFAWFLGSCNRWCQQRGISTDWDTVDKLKQQHGFTSNDPVLENTEINTVTVPKRSQQTQNARTTRESPQREYYGQQASQHQAWWSETRRLREGTVSQREQYHDMLKERRRAERKQKFRGDVTPFWDLWRRADAGQYYVDMEATSPEYNGLAYHKFLHSDIGTAFLDKAPQKVKSLVKPLMNMTFNVTPYGEPHEKIDPMSDNSDVFSANDTRRQANLRQGFGRQATPHHNQPPVGASHDVAGQSDTSVHAVEAARGDTADIDTGSKVDRAVEVSAMQQCMRMSDTPTHEGRGGHDVPRYAAASMFKTETPFLGEDSPAYAKASADKPWEEVYD